MKKLFLSSIFFPVFLIFGFFNIAYADTEPSTNVKIEENNYLKIERTSKELSSRLSKKYLGYEYHVQNICDKPVTIRSVNLWGDSNGPVAYLSTQKPSHVARSETFNKGKSLALPTIGLSMIGAVVALPFSTVKNTAANKKIQKESERFNKPNIQNLTIEPKKETMFRTLAIKPYVPTMRLIYVNPLTDENMTVELKY